AAVVGRVVHLRVRLPRLLDGVRRNVHAVQVAEAVGEEAVGDADAAADVECAALRRVAEAPLDQVDQEIGLALGEVVDVLAAPADRVLDILAVRVRVMVEIADGCRERLPTGPLGRWLAHTLRGRIDGASKVGKGSDRARGTPISAPDGSEGVRA